MTGPLPNIAPNEAAIVIAEDGAVRVHFSEAQDVDGVCPWTILFAEGLGHFLSTEEGGMFVTTMMRRGADVVKGAVNGL